MRTYGRVAIRAPAEFSDEFGQTEFNTGAVLSRQWRLIETDENGANDKVYLTAMIQTIKLNLNESPFYGNYGIPAHAAIVQQIAPDSAMAKIQAFYSRFFSSLTIARVPPPAGYPPTTPCYTYSIVTNSGVQLRGDVAL